MAKNPINKRMNPISRKILDTLGSEWMGYDDLIEQVSIHVPGEIAWRVAEHQRARPYLRRGEEVPERQVNNNTTAIIISGQRTVIRKHLQELKRTDRIEIEYEPRAIYRKPIHIRLSAAELELRNAPE